MLPPLDYQAHKSLSSLIVPDQMLSRVDELAAGVREMLLHRFRIHHPVLQFETRAYEATGLLCCAVAEHGGHAPDEEKGHARPHPG